MAAGRRNGFSAIVSHAINISAPCDGLNMAVDVDLPDQGGEINSTIYVALVDIWRSGKRLF